MLKSRWIVSLIYFTEPKKTEKGKKNKNRHSLEEMVHVKVHGVSPGEEESGKDV